MGNLRFLIQVPAADGDLIAELSKLSGSRRVDESRFDGAEVVRIFFEIAAISGAIASTARSAAAAAKSAAEIIDTLRSIFRKGLDRHRDDANGDFIVVLDEKPFVGSDMSDEENERKLATLTTTNDRFR